MQKREPTHSELHPGLVHRLDNRSSMGTGYIIQNGLGSKECTIHRLYRSMHRWCSYCRSILPSRHNIIWLHQHLCRSINNSKWEYCHRYYYRYKLRTLWSFEQQHLCNVEGFICIRHYQYLQLCDYMLLGGYPTSTRKVCCNWEDDISSKQSFFQVSSDRVQAVKGFTNKIDRRGHHHTHRSNSRDSRRNPYVWLSLNLTHGRGLDMTWALMTCGFLIMKIYLYVMLSYSPGYIMDRSFGMWRIYMELVNDIRSGIGLLLSEQAAFVWELIMFEGDLVYSSLCVAQLLV